jgi:hypothetical protein
MRSFRGFVGGWLLVTGLIVGSHFLHAQGTGSSGGNSLWLSVAGVSNGWVNLILNGTTPGTNYVLLSKQTLTAPSWSNAGTLTGATNQNWTPVSVPVAAQSSCFFQAQSAAGQTTSTNLWLEIPTNSLTTPGQLTVVIHNTLPDQFYDVLTNSSLAAPGLWNVQQSVFGAAGDSTAVQLPMNGPALFVRIRFGVDSTGSGIPDWWWLQYFGSVGGDPFAFDPSGDGLTLWQDYWEGLNPTVFNTPPAPQGLTVSYNPSTSVAMVNWLASSGPVTGYTLERSDSTYFNLSASTTSYADTVPSGAIYYHLASYGPTIYGSYRIQAHYAGGDSTWSDWMDLEASFVSAYLPAGPQGSAYLLVSALPANTAVIRLTRVDMYAEWSYEDPSFDTNFDVPISALTNGLYSIPSNWLRNPVDGYNWADYCWWAQAVNTNGGCSAATYLTGGYFLTQTNGWLVVPYFDGRVQLKQNLIFLLRAGLVDFPFPMIAGILDGQLAWRSLVYSTDYVYSGLYELQFDQSDNENNYPIGFFPLGPFENNYLWRNFVPGPTNLNSNGQINTGAFGNLWGGTYSFFLNNPVYQFQPPSSDWTTVTAVLGTNDTQWLFSYPAGLSLSEIGLTYNSPYLTMASNVRNIYGLLFKSVELLYGTSDGVVTITLPAGQNTTESASFLYPETAQPQFQTVEYDFWSPNWTWDVSSQANISPNLPGYALFSPTNKSLLWITPVASSVRIVGYAKLAVTNGYPGVYAYLGQYFDNAYTEDANGNATTNTTGVLSPYGDFFATQPGPAALVTMPDVDTGARGTCTVYCASAQVDKNSDGNMDLSFSGPDATSQASPMVVWVNNSHTIPGTGGNLDYDKENRGNTSPNYAAGQIICQRDLENFFRLWICGLPVLPANQGYTVTLSMSPVSGSPAINLYDSVETNGGTGYLTDTNIAAQKCLAYAHGTSPYNVYYTGPGAPIAKITPSLSFTFPASYFTNSGNKYFLFEGAGIGSGELLLTISQNGNTIAQTGIWLDLHDIKDFYERMTITNHMSGAISNWSSAIESLQNQTAKISDEDSNIIVFVHGINVGPWDWLDDSDTVFKRLYWAGYHGKFMTVKWPCNFLTPPSPVTLAVFNLSEANAYKASTSLTTYLNQLRSRFPGYRLNLYVHSQGNAVVSEAIKNGAPFDTYILTQGAISDGAYDVNAANDPVLANEEYGNKITPEWQPMGYQGVYTNSNFSGKIVNFYNTNDPVLAVWIMDQVDLKPSGGYFYDGVNCRYTISSNIVTDFQETRSMVARSRSLSVGQSPPESPHGVITSAVDLHANYGFDKAFPADHSAQWTWPIQTTLPYYNQILVQIRPTP